MQKILLIYLSYNYLFSYFLSLYTDPGYVLKKIDNMKTVVTSSYCPKCDMFRSETTHHCKICDKCVADYDHHCFFVGNCIGANNKHFFIRFLTYTTLLSFMHVVMLIDGLVRHYYMSSYSVNLWFKISIFSIMICVSTLGFAFSAFNLWL